MITLANNDFGDYYFLNDYFIPKTPMDFALNYPWNKNEWQDQDRTLVKMRNEIQLKYE